MSTSGATDQQIYESCAKFDATQVEEAAYILWKLWRITRPQYTTLGTCLRALEEDECLHNAVQHSQAVRDYTIIRNWPSPVQSSTHTSEDSVVEAEVQLLLKEIEPAVTRVVDGLVSLPTWSPEDKAWDSSTRKHMHDLRIPLLKGKPSILLHNLGSFKENALLSHRLDNIFMPDNHTFLVNTSGSGKTRILLEGLCHNWGFYFTSTVDASLLGSSDVQKAITSYIPHHPNFHTNLPPSGGNNYDSILHQNREVAGSIFRRILLARLIIFALFVEIMDRRSPHPDMLHIYRKRWLLFQLQPSLAIPTKDWDVFDQLARCGLVRASDHYIDTRIESLLSRIRALCSGNNTFTTHRIPFFCVLDEAQFAASQHTTSFRSEKTDCHRPVLREIVRAWEGQSSGHGVFMIVAGTGISKDVVDQAMSSAIMKDSKYRWCSDTGAFDDAKLQKEYLAKYIPPDFMNSPTGKRLVDRIWYWLHGRHRFTAGFVKELLCTGLQQPHRLLNAYVRHFTDFAITDSCKYLELEQEGQLPNFTQHTLDFGKLKKNSDMLSTIHQLTSRYLMRRETLSLGADEAKYVEFGFARFVDSETQVVAVDEPLVLLSAIQWMKTNHQTTYKLLTREIGVHQPTSNGFENYIAYCIDLIFSKNRKMSEVFAFNGAHPTWADMEAELVALHCSNDERGIIEAGRSTFHASSGPSTTLGVNAKSPESTLAWLNHEMNSPFCFPHQSMGPDILFVLKLEDRSFIWVAVQTKWSRGSKGVLAKKLLLQAMKSITPTKYFLDKNDNAYSPSAFPNLRNEVEHSLSNLPNRRNDAGKHSLLRVIASFPAHARVMRYSERDPDEQGHPLACLNMNLLKQVTKKLSPQDFLQNKENECQDVSLDKESKKRKKTRSEGKEKEKGNERRKKIKLN